MTPDKPAWNYGVESRAVIKKSHPHIHTWGRAVCGASAMTPYLNLFGLQGSSVTSSEDVMWALRNECYWAHNRFLQHRDDGGAHEARGDHRPEQGQVRAAWRRPPVHECMLWEHNMRCYPFLYSHKSSWGFWKGHIRISLILTCYGPAGRLRLLPLSEGLSGASSLTQSASWLAICKPVHSFTCTLGFYLNYSEILALPCVYTGMVILS